MHESMQAMRQQIDQLSSKIDGAKKAI